MITEEQRAEIKRLFHAEKWKIGTIASNLGIHPQTVQLALQDPNPNGVKGRKSLIAPFEEFIVQTLKRYPDLTATRVRQMLSERGYRGSIYPVRRAMKRLSPKRSRAYQDLCFFPAEAAQVDWADLGCLEVSPGCQRRLQCFVMVLAYSRKIFARVFHNQKMGSLLEGHVDAFDFFGGVPKKIIYDNMKTAVIINFGKGVQFNESLIQLAGTLPLRVKGLYTPRSLAEGPSGKSHSLYSR